MTQSTTITAEMRERAGKGTARATRRAGKIPAVLYGNKQPPVLLAVNAKEIEALSRKSGFFTKLFELKVGTQTFPSLARDAQRDPVSDMLVHVDFLRVDTKTKIRVAVPVRFLNPEKSPGIKRGGVLNVVAHTIEVWCAATRIPESFPVDVTGLEINDSIHASMLKLPEGVELMDEEDFTVATIAAPSAIRSEMHDKAEAGPEAAAAAAAPAAGTKPAAGAKPAAGGAAPAAKGGAAAAPAAPAKKK